MPRAPLIGLPPGIWALGVVSMLMDVSSELVHSLLPVFMVSVLGAGMITIGLIEGVAEATAAIVKVFSGVISDRLGRRMPLLILGYGLAAITKPVFALATSIGWVFGARFVDRVGKGIRVAPRDALVADMVGPQQRGAAYGLRQALDSVGAFTGPLLAVALMIGLASDIRAVLWAAVAPALLAVILLVAVVRDPATAQHGPDPPAPVSFVEAKRLELRFWLVVLLGAVFTLARFSEAFLVLRAHGVGLALAYIPLIMVGMNVVYAAVAYPAGRLSDRYGHRKLLLFGLGILVAADGVLAWAVSPWQVFAGAMLWGLHMGLTQGLLNKLVADTAPIPLRGTAFGIFNLASGIALLLASAIAGLLWDRLGAPATFLGGAAFAGLAAAGILIYQAYTGGKYPASRA